MKQKNKFIFTLIFSYVLGAITIMVILRWSPILDIKPIEKINTYEKNSLASSIDKVKDSVMGVNCYQGGTITGTGTAFVYKEDSKYGYLLTNNHVIEGMERITLITSEEKEIEATLLGGDNYLDLAVLRIPKNEVLNVAEKGSSEKARVGDTIFTIGSAMGNNYLGSVTSGIISGKDRKVELQTSSYENADWVMNVIQVDASLNPGNSGGPLLNINGEVIGICSLKLVDQEIEGMGFAIPIELALSHTDDLEAGKKIEWPVLGINMTDINSSTKYTYDTGNITKGAIVTGVMKDSSAEKAGLKEGDIIIEIANKEIKDVANLRYQLYQHKKGDTIKITYIRNGNKDVANVKLQ